MPNDSSAAAVAPLLGEFTCASTEAGFLHQQADAILRDLRRAMVICSLFYVLFSVADLMALGLPGATVPMLARLSMPLVAAAGLRHIRRAADQARAAYAVSSGFTLLGMASYMVVIWYRPGDTLLHGMSVALMASAILIFIPNRLRNAFAIALGASLAFVALAWCLHTESTRHLVTMTMLILFANGFGAIAANRQARLWREQYWSQQVLKNLSVRDPLTGCYNRRHLNAALLDGEIARARRYRLDLSLIMCDLDGFKAINDTYGHQAGDELLRGFATVLQAMTRESIDTVVRYGGEEFLVILPETRLDGASELAERVRAAFAVQRAQVATPIGTLDLGTTASFGVVSIDFGTAQALTAQALIAAADELMYDAKRAGRNRVHAHQLTPQIGQLA